MSIVRPKKTIVTCAITGAVTDPNSTPYLPITPEEIATSALEAAEAGAAVVHIHVRDPIKKHGSMDLDLYVKTVELIKKDNKDLLINLTTGSGAHFSIGKQFLHIRQWRSKTSSRIQKSRPD